MIVSSIVIVDKSKIEEMPGNSGKDCLGNGTHTDKSGNIICLCDDCDYLMCCLPEYGFECEECTVLYCPRKQNGSNAK